MINIDSTTVAVETSAELKTVLEENNTYTLIYLANDIVLTLGAGTVTNIGPMIVEK